MRRVACASLALSAVLAVSACSPSEPVPLPPLPPLPAGAASAGATRQPSGNQPIHARPGDLPAVLRESAGALAAEGTARVVDVTTGGPGVTSVMSGVMSWKTGWSADLSGTSTAAGRKLTVREVIAGDTLYTKVTRDPSGRLPAGWLKLTLADIDKSFGIGRGVDGVVSSAHQGNVPSLLESFAAAGHVSEVGPDTVGGSPATRYRGTVDAEIGGMSAGSPGLPRAAVGTIDYDLWINSDGLPVRLTERLTTAGNTRTETITLSDFGVHVAIAAPPASQVRDGASKYTDA